MMGMSNVQEQLNRRMAELNIEGFSAMGQFSPEDQLSHISEIEKILEGRKKVSGKSGQSVSGDPKSVETP